MAHGLSLAQRRHQAVGNHHLDRCPQCLPEVDLRMLVVERHGLDDVGYIGMDAVERLIGIDRDKVLAQHLGISDFLAHPVIGIGTPVERVL